MHTHKGLQSGSCCFLPLYPHILSLQPSHLLSVTSDIDSYPCAVYTQSHDSPMRNIQVLFFQCTYKFYCCLCILPIFIQHISIHQDKIWILFLNFYPLSAYSCFQTDYYEDPILIRSWSFP